MDPYIFSKILLNVFQHFSGIVFSSYLTLWTVAQLIVDWRRRLEVIRLLVKLHEVQLDQVFPRKSHAHIAASASAQHLCTDVTLGLKRFQGVEELCLLLLLLLPLLLLSPSSKRGERRGGRGRGGGSGGDLVFVAPLAAAVVVLVSEQWAGGEEGLEGAAAGAAAAPAAQTGLLLLLAAVGFGLVLLLDVAVLHESCLSAGGSLKLRQNFVLRISNLAFIIPMCPPQPSLLVLRRLLSTDSPLTACLFARGKEQAGTHIKQG